jgi:hypothetical protein
MPALRRDFISVATAACLSGAAVATAALLILQSVMAKPVCGMDEVSLHGGVEAQVSPVRESISPLIGSRPNA